MHKNQHIHCGMLFVLSIRLSSYAYTPSIWWSRQLCLHHMLSWSLWLPHQMQSHFHMAIWKCTIWWVPARHNVIATFSTFNFFHVYRYWLVYWWIFSALELWHWHSTPQVLPYLVFHHSQIACWIVRAQTSVHICHSNIFLGVHDTFPKWNAYVKFNWWGLFRACSVHDYFLISEQ